MIGELIQQYKILEKLGAGGMGEVYLALDTKLDRKVALKFLPPRISSDPEFKSRFEHEAKATAALNHANIVTVHDLGEHEDRLYIVMEHLTGQSLQDIIDSDQLTSKETLDYAAQICEGLVAAHKAGVIHRDIKPANIIVTKEGRAKILDFGLAKSNRATTETKVGSTLGTVQYEAPEQSRGEESDARSDIFSLGVVFYEMITGKLPFAGEYEAAIRYAISHETPEPLARFKADVPAELQWIIDKTLEKEPADRYQTVGDMLVDIRRLKRDTAPRSGITPSSTAVSVSGGKRVGPIVVAALIILVAVTGYFIRDLFNDDSSPQGIATTSAKTLAVLPFQNLGSPEDEYFADGITEEISARVARLKGLSVTARTSIGQYKGTSKSIKEIGAELGVNYVLKGTIRWDKSGDIHRVRITPQLIRVSDETFIWTDNIQKDLSQIFEVQAEIAMQIAGALKVTLQEGDQSSLVTVPTNDIEAYDNYLRGRSWMEKRFQAGAYDSALAHFARATEIDPMYGEAHAWKAATHIWRSFFLPTGKTYHEEQSLESMKQALAIYPDLPEAILAQGMYLNLVEREYDSALVRFMQIKDRIREQSVVYREIAVVRFRQGEWELAKEAFAEALRLDPHSTATLMLVTNLYEFTRDYDEGLRLSDLFIAEDHLAPYGYYIKALIHIKKDRNVEAARRVLDRIPDGLSLEDIITTGHLYYDFLGATPIRFGLVDFSTINRDKLIEGLLSSSGSRHAAMNRSLAADIYAYTGDSAMAKILYDSAVIVAEKFLQENVLAPSQDQLVIDHHVRSWAALLYARAGQFETGIEQAAMAMELMPVDECHW